MNDAKFTFDLPQEKLDALRKLAERNNRTVAGELRRMIDTAIKQTRMK